MAWDYTETEYAKQAATDPVWGLERLINGGLPGGGNKPRASRTVLTAIKNLRRYARVLGTHPMEQAFLTPAQKNLTA